MQFDFRSVYTSILQDWFQVTPATLTQLFGRSFPYVPVLRPGALLAATQGRCEVAEFTVYPNPVAPRRPHHRGLRLRRRPRAGGAARSLGREVRRAVDRCCPAARSCCRWT